MKASVILNATLMLVFASLIEAFECEADHQCESGYCYVETGKCVACVDCALYMRHPSEIHVCGRGPENCGECLQNFENDYLFDGTIRSFCVPKKQKGIENETVNSANITVTSLAVSAVGLIVLLALFIFKRVLLGKRFESCSNNHDAEHPSPALCSDKQEDNICPPYTYDSSIPLLERPSDVSSALVTTMTIIEENDAVLQKAVPFRKPSSPYGHWEPGELENEVQDIELEDILQPDSSSSDDDNEGSRAISPPQLEDEDTMPSNWTHCTVNEESCSQAEVSVAVSLPNLSVIDEVPQVPEENLNDSGVSASCSQQSDLSCAHEVEKIEVLPDDQDAIASSSSAIMQRHHSEEDLSASEISARKRARRDSGSSSMTSMEPFHEDV